MVIEVQVNKIGFVFQPAQRFAGWVLIFAGLLTAYLQGTAALLITIFGLVVTLLKKYMFIDLENHRIKSSKSFFPWMPTGKWHGIQNYPFVTMIRKVISSSLTNYGAQQKSSTGRNVYYDVLLLSNSHRSKIVINRLKNKEEAQAYADETAKMLSRKLVVYKPQRFSPRPQRRQSQYRSKK